MNKAWSAQQLAIFDWFETGRFKLADGSGFIETHHLVVRARAGTGKTTTIIEGINKAPEQKILLAAFNKKIAEELASRIKNPNAEAKTLHAVGYACVRRFWEGLRIASGSDRANDLTEQVCGPTAPDAIKRLVSNLHSKGREIVPHAREMGDLTDIAVQFECVPDEQWESAGYDLAYVEHKALDAMDLAARVKPTVTGIDFADMIFLPVRNHWLTKMWDLVVVDEAQDMTTAQLEIAQGVCRGRVCVVGDDRQAIYGFRGADSGALDRLKRHLGAAELGLTITYRCGSSIVELAKRLVPDFECAVGTHVGKVETLPKDKLTETAGPGDFILSRLNAPLVSTAMSLLRAGKRTTIAGRDIGAGLKALVRKLKGKSVPDFLSKVAAWEEREVHRLEKMKKPERIEAIYDQGEMLRQLADGAKSVDEVTARIDALFTDDGLGQAGMITCSSVHRSKGLEADRVFILRETLRDTSEEERNITYVAITRAKQTLVWVGATVEETVASYAAQQMAETIREDRHNRLCPDCGSVVPIDQSCGCFDNGCQ